MEFLMDYLKLEIKNQEDRDFINVLLLSMMQMDSFCKSRKNIEVQDLSYDRETKDIELFELFVSSSNLWVDQKIEEFNLLLSSKIQYLEISKNEYYIIKYLTEMYWHYIDGKVAISEGLSISDKLESLLTKSEGKKIFKIVK
tara:strand:- start:18520 stop:18945 length:426 start_codon:yes stop_codon:yes gene_type:complete